MKIKARKKYSQLLFSPLFKLIINNKTKILSITIFILIIFLVGTFFGMILSGYLGTFDNPSYKARNIMREQGIVPNLLRMILHENIRIPFNYIKGQFAPTKKLFLDIPFANYQKLSYKREEAFKQGYFVSTPEDYVKATLTYDNKKTDITLRLKGYMLDNVDTDKWSLKIKVKGNNAILGMKEFSLQHPETRNYLHAWIVHEALKNENIITPRLDYVTVVINGKNKGVYVLEENFDKRLLEHNNYLEGPILYWDEDLLWQRKLQEDYIPIDVEEAFIDATIGTFQTRTTLEQSDKRKQFLFARNLLESFRRGDLPAHQVFNADKMASYIAVSDVLGGKHGMGYTNMRYYYNPITSLLEPISYDAIGYSRIVTAYYVDVGYGDTQFRELLLQDEIFVEKYLETLERVSHPDYLANIFHGREKEIKEKLQIIHADYPYAYFQKDLYDYNAQVIRYLLNPPQILQAYVHGQTPSTLTLTIANIQPLPVNILHVLYQDTVLPLRQATHLLAPQHKGNPLSYQSFTFSSSENINITELSPSNLTIVYQILGKNTTHQTSIFPWPHHTLDFLATNPMRKETSDLHFDFFHVDESTRSIFMTQGSWILNETFIIPPGYTFIAKPGTTLDLQDGATIISYSPLHFIGSEDNPITLTSSDGRGQGIAVLNSEQPTQFRYVNFQNLSNPMHQDWQLTGALTFYESPVTLAFVSFSNIQAEDALHIIRSPFAIQHTFFNHTSSDCIDVDFSEGTINTTLLVQCGNDGIDFSGSVAQLTDITVTNFGDKGLSVGEKSDVQIVSSKIHKGYICLASKDLSELVVEETELSSCRYGFAAYQKKSEFGQSTIHAQAVAIKQTEEDHIIEEDSMLSLDAGIIEGDHKNVYQTLYGDS